MAELQQLAVLLQSTFSLDANVRRSAEKQLEELQQQPGFGLLPLQLACSEQADKPTRQAAALLYKNFIKRNWKQDESSFTWREEDRTTLKQQIVSSMISLSGQNALQIQIGEAISVMAESDFPQEWGDLLQQLIDHLTPDNFVVNNAVLQTAHSIFKRWRSKFRSDALFLEIKFVLERFCQPYLAVFQRADELLSSPTALAAPADPKTLAKSLLLCLQLFFDLNSQDIPEFFEDNQEPFMALLHKYLNWSRPELVSSDDDEEAGDLEKIRASICEIVELYSQRYQDVFPQMDQFVETVWKMVTSLSAAQKYDILVSKAIKFLSVVVKMPGKQAIFANPATLEQFAERIILPNMSLRDFEEELFEDDPLEYLRRDLEGSDSETRRQAAAEFTQALMQQYEQQITSIITRYINSYLAQYNTNPQAEWKAKDTAIFLLTSIASRSSTSQHGVTSTNALVDIVRFFSEHVVQDLQASANTVHPIIQADAIKFLYTFRSQLSKDQLISVLPLLIPKLESDSFVIHTYAATTIERCFYVKRDGRFIFTQTDIRALAEPILVACLQKIESGGTPEKIAQNDHLMKCVMRTIITAKQGLTANYKTILQHLVAILTEVSKNPSNPKFNHFAFESISALIRFVVIGNPSTLDDFESSLFPPFTFILQQDVAEFSPFVFQILSQLLELHTQSTTLPEAYKGLIGPLLMGSLWMNAGNVPALVRLLRAIMAKGSNVLVETNQVGSIKDIARFLIESTGRKHDAVSTDLVEAMWQYLPVDAISTISRDLWIILLTRLMQKRTETFVQGLVKAIFTAIALDRPGLTGDSLIEQLDQVQAGIFGQILIAILPDIQKTPFKNRKAVALGMIRLLTQSQRMLVAPLVQQWPAVMEALLRLFLLPQDIRSQGQDDDELQIVDPDELSYHASFSRLGASESARVDPFASIAEPRDFLKQQLEAASQVRPGVYGPLLQQVPAEFRSRFESYLASTNTRIL